MSYGWDDHHATPLAEWAHVAAFHNPVVLHQQTGYMLVDIQAALQGLGYSTEHMHTPTQLPELAMDSDYSSHIKPEPFDNQMGNSFYQSRPQHFENTWMIMDYADPAQQSPCSSVFQNSTRHSSPTTSPLSSPFSFSRLGSSPIGLHLPVAPTVPSQDIDTTTVSLRDTQYKPERLDILQEDETLSQQKSSRRARKLSHRSGASYNAQQGLALDCRRRRKLSSAGRHIVHNAETEKHYCEWPACFRHFNRKEHLDRHSLMHSGLRAYHCPCTQSQPKCEPKSRHDNYMDHLKCHVRSWIIKQEPSLATHHAKIRRTYPMSMQQLYDALYAQHPDDMTYIKGLMDGVKKRLTKEFEGKVSSTYWNLDFAEWEIRAHL